MRFSMMVEWCRTETSERTWRRGASQVGEGEQRRSEERAELRWALVKPAKEGETLRPSTSRPAAAAAAAVWPIRSLPSTSGLFSSIASAVTDGNFIFPIVHLSNGADPTSSLLLLTLASPISYSASNDAFALLLTESRAMVVTV